MERIVFLDRDTIMATLRPLNFAHEWREYAATRPDEVVERLRGATIAVTNKVPLRRDVLEGLPDLKFIAVAATGVDVIDVECCRGRGIVVSNVRDYAVRSVPEHVFALVLALRRSITLLHEDVRGGAWQESAQFALLDRPLRDIHGSTLGIVGYGTLGRAVEKLGLAFGMRALVAEHKGAREVRPGRVSFDEVLRGSDVLTLHCPLTEETRALIGAAELRAMKPDTLLINTARGGLVDERALTEALRAGVIAGAGVDVLSEEPPRGGNPLLDAGVPNLIVTPHVAWASREAVQTLTEQLAGNLEALAAGAPRNLVT